MKKIQITSESKSDGYEVCVGFDLLPSLYELVPVIGEQETNRVFIFSDSNVFRVYGKALTESLSSYGVEVASHIFSAGEEYKNLASIEDGITFLSKARATRSDLIIALGGGVVGDMAGFCAAIYRRGIRFVQVPTTLLSMVDSSVGGKTGFNTSFGKNMIGAFNNPVAVLADVGTLRTLDSREIRAGYYELIKHGIIGGQSLLDQTSTFLSNYSLTDVESLLEAEEYKKDLIDLVGEQVKQKARVVNADTNEDPDRSDSSSRKILNFGHTIGHALERATDYAVYKHGEAVGIGMLVAIEISKRLEFVGQDSINLLNDVIHRVGSFPDSKNIAIESVLEAISHDKKSSGTRQQWVLLRGIGSPTIVTDETISSTIVRESLNSVLTNT